MRKSLLLVLLFLDSIQGKVESIKQFICYCCEKDSFYSALSYDAIDSEGLFFADTVLYPID